MNRFPLTFKFWTPLCLTFATMVILASVSPAQIKLRSALDFDGDKKADFGVFRQSNNGWYVLNSGGGGYVGQAFGTVHTDTPAPGDYDDDGKGDLAVWRYSNGTFYYVESGTNTFKARQWGVVGDELAQRDYDGDGKTDLAVVRRSGGVMNWYILNSQSGSFRAQQFGLNTDYAVPADYDGDGKFDIAVQRGAGAQTAAAFYILGSTIGYYGASWGLGSDQIVTGDYDGDGKTDLAVARKVGTGLIWYVLNSTNGQIRAINFGVAETDSPVQNDYDGDGKTDFAVWRETDGTFYVLRSSDGNATATKWGLMTDLPLATYDAH